MHAKSLIGQTRLFTWIVRVEPNPGLERWSASDTTFCIENFDYYGHLQEFTVSMVAGEPHRIQLQTDVS